MADGAARKGFDLDLRDGQAAENTLLEVIQSGNGLVEVKRDQMARQTGNVYIETSYRGQPSGITSTEADWWAIEVDENVFVLMRTERLRELIRYRRNIEGGDNNWSMGKLLPVEKLVRG